MRVAWLPSLAMCVLLATPASAATPRQTLDPAPAPQRDDLDRTVSKPGARIAVGDTTWIADWSFDAGVCDDAGWIRADNRILNDGSNYWHVSSAFAGTGGIANQAAVLSKHDLLWARDGYGNNWDYSIVLQYRGAGATLGFDYLSDSEPSFDFVTVEADSAGASEARVDYGVDPGAGPDRYRSELLSVAGVQNTAVTGLALPDFGVPATTHEVYIRFASDSGYSDEDGIYPSQWNAGLVVDNIVVTGALAYAEDFEAALGPNVSFANTAPATPFGEWARLYAHITDNDACSENTTCAWLFTDPTLAAASPATAFGPGGAVIRNWLDDVLISPWVSLGANTAATILSYRRFPGNNFNNGRIVMNWSMRAQVRVDNTDTSAAGDSIDAVTPWQHVSSWNSLSTFTWITSVVSATQYVPATATAVQVRFRVSDWQYIQGATAPATVDPGPGPFLDRVRIGRRVFEGPRIDVPDPTGGSHLAQDTFPSALQTYSCAWRTMPYHFPSTDRFGTCDFSRAGSIGWGNVEDPCCIGHCDSIQFYVHDEAGVGIADVWLLGAIVSGPHAGKAPPPWTVEPSGFFRVPAQRGNDCGGTTLDNYNTDLDDEYFRGGDVLLYLLVATDQQGGFGSYPPGLASEPTSVAQAEAVTGGLLEVSFLPTIDWDPAYLARIAADPNGKLDPTPAEIANSSQASCMLYVNQQDLVPRHGLAHRSAFLRTLDRLGYASQCDVYDLNERGQSTTNNQIAGRATVEQMTGYALVVHDTGRYGAYTALPNHPCAVEGFYDQAQWYRDWLAAGATSEAGRATLWVMGARLADSTSPSNPLVFDDMGVTFVSATQPAGIVPQVVGQAIFTWADNTTTDFTADSLRVAATSCPGGFAYNGIGASGTAVVSHRFEPGSTPGEGGIVLHADPAAGWNTVFASLDWGALYEAEGSPPGTPADVLAGRILQAVLPDCQAAVDPTDVAHGRGSLPAVSRLRGNVPNPFNPTTTIVFDLQREGPVRVQIYDVAGRRLRTLVDGSLPAGWGHRAVWNGMDDSGSPVASGLYFVRLETAQVSATRKVVLVR